MFSFAEENGGSLMEFFQEALRARKEAILHPGGVHLQEWSSCKNERSRIMGLCPLFETATDTFQGIHSDVFLFDDCVVKTNVFDQYYRDGQYSWLKWCLSRQNNPLVPRMSMLLMDVETERFLAVMEKLEPHGGFEHHSFREDIDNALRESFQRLENGPAFRKKLLLLKRDAFMAIDELQIDISMLDAEEDQEMVETFSRSIDEHTKALRYIDELMNLNIRLSKQQRQHFRPILRKFKAATNIGQVIDVHSYNWMKRTNGEYVILDPIN